ncbi:hypothetical protein K450DRAFT_262116 [Umbelopsis ramanniana AG]|uniref:Uncharacterized protein n=1 Tax=Umbelopsis ramanniana AG TaxID=1314678 RepID=A0AAD5E272_UMBRA|nr:uncharacterized protein K450DRAFT_262116 [Umbelopsis ramanniana AG]KAI8575367.1 hypothetical protein K450DRAFT_262116 [Umbelopsis ramanniana AG]
MLHIAGPISLCNQYEESVYYGEISNAGLPDVVCSANHWRYLDSSGRSTERLSETPTGAGWSCCCCCCTWCGSNRGRRNGIGYTRCCGGHRSIAGRCSGCAGRWDGTSGSRGRC